MRKRISILCMMLLLLLSAEFINGPTADAQMVQTATPFQTFGSSFYEQNGVNWSLRGPNFFANSGGGVAPPFGNPDLNAGLRTGFGFGGGGGISGSLGFNFAQGSSRTMTSTTPSVTTMNGYPGTISSQTLRPFVTGVTPVIGGNSFGAPVSSNVSSQMFNSHQQSQAMQRRSRAQAGMQAKQQKAVEAFERGIQAESEGNLRKARANYRKALASDQGPLRQQIMVKMHARGWK
jgi:hypothetical protein